jgi:hypothetical protein
VNNFVIRFFVKFLFFIISIIKNILINKKNKNKGNPKKLYFRQESKSNLKIERNDLVRPQPGQGIWVSFLKRQGIVILTKVIK